MKLSNDQIIQILEDYLNNPSYNQAILIDGAWGSGKTYFLKEHFKKHLQGKFDGDVGDKYLYISLYGITSTESIQKLIFQSFRDDYLKKLDDKLPEKMKLFKSSTTSNKKIDIDFQSIAYKSVASFTSNWLLEKGIDSTEFELVDFVSPQNIVIIFDDLERCQVDIHEILGYINNLVEHNGVKSIVVANEEQISRGVSFSSVVHTEEKNISSSISSENTVTYKRTKEKLIGLTIKYEPYLEEIYDKVMESIIHGNLTRVELRKYKNDILAIFAQRQHQNIRTLHFFFIAYEKLSTVFKQSSDKFNDGKENVMRDVTIYLAKASIYSAEGFDFKEWSEKDGEIRFTELPCETLLQALENDRIKTLEYHFVDTLIFQGYLDKNKTQDILESLYEEKYQIILVEKKLAPWFRGDDTENEKLLNELRQDLSVDLYTANQCFRILSIVLVMELFILKDFDYDSLIVLLLEKATSKLSELGPVKTLEVLGFATFCTPEHEQARVKYLSHCESIKLELKNTQLDIALEMNELVTQCGENWGESLALICRERGQEFAREESFLHLFEWNALLTSLQLSSPKNILSFTDVLIYVYNNIYVRENAEILKNLQNKIIQINQSQEDGYKNFAYTSLLLTLKYQIDQHLKENRSDQVPTQSDQETC